MLVQQILKHLQLRLTALLTNMRQGSITFEVNKTDTFKTFLKSRKHSLLRIIKCMGLKCKMSFAHRDDLGEEGFLCLAEESFTLDSSDGLWVKLSHGLPRQPEEQTKPLQNGRSDSKIK